MTLRGERTHPLYAVWSGMKSRCYTPTATGFAGYGGRGVTVCDEWRYDFAAFYAWALPRWQSGLQLDRRDNRRGYSPRNCRFVTAKENANNRRHSTRTVWLTAFGDTKTMKQWPEDSRCAVSYSTLVHRILVNWEPAAAISKPPHSGRYT